MFGVYRISKFCNGLLKALASEGTAMMDGINANAKVDVPVVVCVGDSITFGDTGLGYRAEHPWPEQLDALLGVNAVNCGHNGAASADYPSMDEFLLAKRHMPQAAALLVGLGVNDVAHDFVTSVGQVPEALARVKALIDDLRSEARPSLEVCLLSVPQLSLDDPIMSRFGYQGLARMNPLLADLDHCYREACPDLGWHYIDYAPVINGHRELHGDSIHPNQLGYDSIAVRIAALLKPILGK